MQLQRTPRRFLARPFWRDHVLAYVLIGVGFTIVGIGASLREGLERLFILTAAVTLFAFGLAVLSCAVGWSLWSTWRSWRSRRAA